MSGSRIAYLDCFSGISGDMLLGALIGAGAPIAAVDRAVRGLGLSGVRVACRRVRRAGFAATKFDVFVRSGRREVEGGGHALHPPGWRHPGHDHGPGGEPARRVSAASILARIRRGRLPARVKERASAVFDRLARAEARAHGTPVARVHFHEVGAVDSIVDVVGAAAALEALGIESVHCSPLPITRGHIHGAHGILPVPAPAALELMRGLPVLPVDVEGEWVTPTGAALAAALSSGFGSCPAMRIRAIGTGAGARDEAGRPNILRVLVGEAVPASEGDVVWIVETNLDNVSGEVIGHVLERLFRAGAVDAWTAPIQMKKSRPGVLLSALCPPASLAAVEEVLFRETPTFGVRRHPVERATLDRRQVAVRTPYGPVRVKVGRRAGAVMTVSPEFEDCRELAARRGVPLREAMRAALEAFREGKAQ